ncbi:MAG: ABC transporter substrate-binding protein, partial [Roseicyclus sp.]
YGKAPLGSGPFRFVDWQQGQQLVVAPNPHWHGGELAFERLTFLFTDADTSFAAAMTGDANVVAVPPALARRQVAGMRMAAFRTVDNRGMMFPVVPDDGRTTEAGHPIGNDVTADPAIRRAINLALDREALVALALDGFGAPAQGPVDGLPWDNPDAAVRSPDRAAATNVLDEAGWLRGDDGLRRKDGLEARFRLVYPATDSTRQALALGVADQLRPLGIEVVPTGRSWDEIRTLAHSNAVLFGWGAHDPLEIYNLYHSSRSGSGFFNAGFYANPTVDARFEAAQTATSLEASLPHWQAAQWDGETGFGAKGDAAWAWLVNLDHVYFVDECLDLGRPQIHPHGHGFPITHAIETWRWTCAE